MVMNPYQLMRMGSLLEGGQGNSAPPVLSFYNALRQAQDEDKLDQERQMALNNMVDAGKITGNPALAGKLIPADKAATLTTKEPDKAELVDLGKITGNPILNGHMVAPEKILPYLESQNRIQKENKKLTAQGKLGAKSDENLQRVSQALTNLQNLSDTYEKLHGENLKGIANVAALPGGESLMSMPFMKNINSGFNELNTAQEDSKNMYARATMGRVSNDMLKMATPLHNIAGLDPQTAKAQLDQLANSLKGVSNGIVNSIAMQKGPEAGKAAQDFMDQEFGKMRFMPSLEQPQGSPPGAGMATSNPNPVPRGTAPIAPQAPGAGGPGAAVKQLLPPGSPTTKAMPWD